MSPYAFSSIASSEARRVGEVQRAAFADDVLTLGVLARIPEDAYID
jgi:hypothetical protein